MEQAGITQIDLMAFSQAFSEIGVERLQSTYQVGLLKDIGVTIHGMVIDPERSSELRRIPEISVGMRE